MSTNRNHTETHTARHGMVLIVVLVVISMLTLAAYTFTESMLLEAEATAVSAQTARARRAAESGLEYAAAYLQAAAEGELVDFYDSPDLFRAIPVSSTDTLTAQFSLIATAEWDETASAVRYGLFNESNKLNLNTLIDEELSDTELQDRLLVLPGMTIDIADGILDWLDEDDEPREYGAEYDYYVSLEEPILPRNGAVLSLDELLHVPGVTRELLYGWDTNANGILDPSEQGTSDTSLIGDLAGMQMGWSRYLTIYSGESNLDPYSMPKIDVNQESLTDLYDALVEVLGAEAAEYIVAYRIAGESSGNGGGSSGGGRGGDGSNPIVIDISGGRDSDAGDSGGGNSGSGGGGGGSGGSSGSGEDTGEDSSRGGLDLSNGGSVTIVSLYQLLGAEVEISQNGSERTIPSPWPNSPEIVAEEWPLILQTLSTSADPSISGRININTASREVLLSVPGLEETTVDSILAVRSPSGSSGQAIFDTSGWLLAENLVELSEMRELDRYLTGGGDVYRVQSVGFFDAGGVSVRLDAVLDATELPPRLLFQRDLTHLGRGYSPEIIQLPDSSLAP
ncbi:type II secretion system protein GspK [Rubinisphaera brasiliensis]|nr:type II secretion system protein GspK [Rubinisphaera brasiliensis]